MTNDTPIAVASSNSGSMLPLEARKNPPATEIRLPKMMPGFDTDDDHGETKGDHVPTLLFGGVQVQEEVQVHQQLYHRHDHHDRQGRALGEGGKHHQAEWNDRQDDRQDEADHVALESAMALGGMPIDDGEDEDPDDVQEVPEQAQARQAGHVGGGQTLGRDLQHQHDHPDQTRAHVQTVGTDQGEERGQEGTAIRTIALMDQMVELIEFHADEAGTEQPGNRQPTQDATLAAMMLGDHGEAVGDTGEQQQEGFDQDERQFEDVLLGGAIGMGPAQDCIGREQRPEQNAVGHEVGPEAEPADDRSDDAAHEAGNGQPPDVPDQGEAEDQGEEADHDTGASVARHVDLLVVRILLLGDAFLFHAPVGVDVVHFRHFSEVVEGRRRRGRPFQGTAIPRIARHVHVLRQIAVADTDVEHPQLAQDAQGDDAGADGGGHQEGVPVGVVVVVQTTGHAHEAQHVQRHEGDIEADQPAPEGLLIQLLVQLEAEDLREPVDHAGEVAEHGAADDHVVEVGDQEQAVVQHEVGTRYRQQDAGHAADAEGHDEAQGPEHRRGELDAALIHGEQPGEDLHPCRDRNDHGRDAEEGVDVSARAHGEEVVQPDDEGQHGNGYRCPDHRDVAEQTLLAEGGGHFREHAESRQDQDVYLGVAPGPDQVGVHHLVATRFRGKEVEAQVTVQGQQRQGHGQDREGCHDQDGSTPGGPGEDRHAHQGHALGTHLQHGHEEVDACQGRPDTGELKRPDVVVHPYARTVLDA
ncbi:hypothetical protein EHI8A_167850 [Entamoeba histolytica HM-1:IMSS-B]|uniref:Uncharacterized protein n=1 Tax=Entamoeba histolytica HM-1:IMSS-B TaxID=885319 RepID=M3TVL4_ENTH1|nr:hypothetical protein EHI8A_167850 [Entamoeba histolytica HM-1:IMSS-B]